MNRKSILSAIAFFLLVNTFSFSQGRKFVNEFLNIGVGAQNLSMFGARAATTNDITAAYWNPSGLLNIEAPFQVSAMHAEWFAGIAQYDYLGFGKKLGKDQKAFGGISVIRMGVDNIPNTINLIGSDGRVNYDEVSQFSAADYAFILSYARKFGENTRLGGNTKIIYRQIGKFANAWGFGFDLGTQIKFNNFSIGIVGKDITSTFTSWAFNFTEEEKAVFASTGNEIPKSSVEFGLPKIIAGLAYEGGLGKDKKSLTYLVEFDLNFSTDGRRHSLVTSDFIDISPALGLQFGFRDKVFFRAGFGNLQRVLNEIDGDVAPFEIQPNIGLGLKLGRLSIDYALANAGEVSSVLYSHIFSVALNLQGKQNAD
ncbi:MAG: PorV/PorQ family protein [Deltaproteobacteria bacterium]